MAKADRQRNEQFNQATAEKVVGWKAVHKHNGELIGNKQDKVGRSRKAKVLDYANDQRRAYAIDEDESSWPVGSVSESSRYDHEGENLASRVGHTGDPIDGTKCEARQFRASH